MISANLPYDAFHEKKMKQESKKKNLYSSPLPNYTQQGKTWKAFEHNHC